MLRTFCRIINKTSLGFSDATDAFQLICAGRRHLSDLTGPEPAPGGVVNIRKRMRNFRENFLSLVNEEHQHRENQSIMALHCCASEPED